MKLPPYYPDAPEVRDDVATYHDNITAMDYLVGDVLKWLDDRKLADNTVVFFFGDHGWGMPRGKRGSTTAGSRVPFLVRWPGRSSRARVRDDLVAFLDFAPTVLRSPASKSPERMQGQVFLGDERRSRASTSSPPATGWTRRSTASAPSATSASEYIRNFYPELPYAQYIIYMDEMPTMQGLAAAGVRGQAERPAEALLRPDQAEGRTLRHARPTRTRSRTWRTIPRIADKLKELRAALDQWIEGHEGPGRGARGRADPPRAGRGPALDRVRGPDQAAPAGLEGVEPPHAAERAG